jgi:hypothetical protein
MYNPASKLLAPLFDPLTLAILLAICALLAWKYRRLAMRLLIVAVVLLLAFTSVELRKAQREIVRSAPCFILSSRRSNSRHGERRRGRTRAARRVDEKRLASAATVVFKQGVR